MLLEVPGIFSDFFSGNGASPPAIRRRSQLHLGASRIHLVYMLMRELIGASSKQTGSYKNLHLTNAKYSETTTTTRATNAIR